MATKNEEDNIYSLMCELKEYDIIIVDDSTDATREIISEFPNVTLIYGNNAGIAESYKTALTTALEFDCPVLQMDAGFSHPPRYIPRFLQAEADLVLGARRFRGGTRAFISRWAGILMGAGIEDVTSGFRLWQPWLLKKVLPKITRKGNAFQMETLGYAQKLGATIDFVNIQYILTNSHLKPWMLTEALGFVIREGHWKH